MIRRADQIHQLVAKTRRDQGLPPTVEDGTALASVARLIAAKGGRR